MSTVAFLFPGQGSQEVGMGRQAYQADARARAVFEEAEARLGFPLTALCFEGPEAELQRTEQAQPALLTASCALLALLGEAVRPAWCAGHSLGEYTALVAAGALDFGEAVALVRRRGELMQAAAAAQPGAMSAILKLSDETVIEICARAGQGEVLQPANFNAPGQVVISGTLPAVARAEQQAAERGGRAWRLKVSGAFHSALMAPAAEGLRQVLTEVPLREAAVPVVANVNAAPMRDAETIRRNLAAQVVQSVQWAASIRWMADQGVDTFVEIGPGQVLTGLLKRIQPHARGFNVRDPATAEAFLAAMAA
jgi:[acyl-carrier-protein] S-malonyltransferase